MKRPPNRRPKPWRPDPRASSQPPARGLTGRRLRRLSVSDSPGRFQKLATATVLEALGAGAVAWIPSDGREAVVSAGDLSGASASDFRALCHSADDPRSRVVVRE